MIGEGQDGFADENEGEDQDNQNSDTDRGKSDLAAHCLTPIYAIHPEGMP